MHACVLNSTSPIQSHPLRFTDVPIPCPGPGEVLIKVRACGVCRTDLHVIEGELQPRKSPLIPGHQVVGIIEATGKRVGVPWLHHTCGVCEFCRTGRENLCEKADFTGYTVDGGYAQYIVAPEAFVYPIPNGFADLHAAPLLCAGIIGFRCLRLAGLSKGARLGFYGFGAAASVAIQVASYWGIEVYAMTRDERHRKLALELGAVFAGGTVDDPPQKLDAAIVFAPAGEIVPSGLKALKRGGTLVLGGIHMSAIPSFDYNLLYWERSIRSVANNTRADGLDFLKVAAEIPIRTRTEVFPLNQTNEALDRLKNDAIDGAAVIQVD